MIRGVLLTVTTTVTLVIAGAYSSAQSTGAAKAPAAGGITVTQGDSGQFRITWTTRANTSPENWIIRRTGAGDTVTIQVPGSQGSYVDWPKATTGASLSYSVWALINGQADFYQLQKLTATAPKATALFCDGVKSIDSTQWMPIGGNWIIQDGAIVQKDDGKPSPGTPDIRALIFKNTNRAASLQITASVQVNLSGDLQKAYKARSDAKDKATRAAADATAAKAASDAAAKAAGDADTAKKTIDNALADAGTAATRAQADDDAAARTKPQADDAWARACAVASAAQKADEKAATTQKNKSAAMEGACALAADRKKADDDAAAARTRAHDDLKKANAAAATAKEADDAAATTQKNAEDALKKDATNDALKAAKAAADRKKTETAADLTTANAAAATARTNADTADQKKTETAADLIKADADANAARVESDAATADKARTAAALTAAQAQAKTDKDAVDAAAKDKEAKDAAVLQVKALIDALTRSSTKAGTTAAVARALADQAAKALQGAGTAAKAAGDAVTSQPPFDKGIAARVGLAFATNATDGKGFAWLLQADQDLASVRFVQDGVKLGKTLLLDNGWQPAKKYWLKLRLDTSSGKTVLSGKAWPDSAPEPSDWQLIQDDWTWPAASIPLLPSLCGGVYAAGKNEISVAFSDLCIEAFPATATAMRDGKQLAGPSLLPARLVPPDPDKTIDIAQNALTRMSLGPWGTPYSARYISDPIKLPCFKGPCLWTVPTASKPPECGCSAGFPVTDLAIPLVLPGTESLDCPAGWPIGGPDPLPSGEILLAPESVHSAAMRSGPDPAASSGRRSAILRTSFGEEEPPVQSAMRPMAHVPDPGPELPDLTSPEAPPARILPEPKPPKRTATRRQLRDIGAVATAPWPRSDDDIRSPSTRGADPIGPDEVSHDPFSYRPRVDIIPLPPARSASSGLSSSGALDLPPDLDEIVDAPSGRVWTYHFDLPARFPRIANGAACCAFEGEGAVIHEGMRLLARQDGQYEARFNITIPPMPVLLRLQLLLFLSADTPPRTLTLPPITLKPWGTDSYPDPDEPSIDPVSYLVRVRGYSQVIKEVQTRKGYPPKPFDHFLLVKRIGAARFGSGFQNQPNQ